MAFYSKKEQEEKCLKIALNARKTQHGQSRRILDLLCGDDFPRSSQERPDFVKLSKQDDDYVLVGIEHFSYFSDFITFVVRGGVTLATDIPFANG